MTQDNVRQLFSNNLNSPEPRFKHSASSAFKLLTAVQA